VEAAEAAFDGGATQIFRGVGSHVQAAPVAARGGESRRMPQVGLFDQPVQRCSGERPRGVGDQRIEFAREICCAASRWGPLFLPG